MKKFILLTVVSGAAMLAMAQTPDSTRQPQLNTTYPPDSTMANPNQAPVQMTTPGTTTMPDSMSIPPYQPATPLQSAPPNLPVNTDVRNNTMPQDSGTAAPLSPADSTASTTDMSVPAVPVTSPSSNETMPATGTMGTMTNEKSMQTSGTDYNLPRGVNNPSSDMMMTGLGKWSALPILNTYVPQEVVDKIKAEHGDHLYDITMLKTGENQYAYSARVQDNGVYHNVIVNDNAGMNSSTTTPANTNTIPSNGTVPVNTNATTDTNKTIPKQ